MVPPEDTWLRRTDNEATVGCFSSHQTWHLRCTENQWIGVIGNCSRGNQEANNESSEVIDILLPVTFYF